MKNEGQEVQFDWGSYSLKAEEKADVEGHIRYLLPRWNPHRNRGHCPVIVRLWSPRLNPDDWLEGVVICSCGKEIGTVARSDDPAVAGTRRSEKIVLRPKLDAS
jgi:hypothetical protein